MEKENSPKRPSAFDGEKKKIPSPYMLIYMEIL